MGLKETVDAILDKPHLREWTLQGFGMLRCYLGGDEVSRLQVWSRDDRVPGLTASYSDVHTHPWDFVSHLFYGQLVNIRYEWCPYRQYAPSGESIVRQLMRPGSGTHMLADGEKGELIERRIDVLSAGDSYSQEYDEIHRSVPFTGCVTVLERDRGSRPDEAFTFYRHGTEWVSAKPRPATIGEIERIIGAVRRDS